MTRPKRAALLGDRIDRVLTRLGGRRLAVAVARVTGRPCGCARRTAALNAWDKGRRKP
ncbi:MAG: hypothetical protein P9F19_01500 [Candidatus Contendobacter sp.]|nr:hypothetical protein [Candidatus Contendobacter sp.]MDG4556065.1 hypothetical protein [Candidatus Contendobacter sp.]